MRAAWLRFRNGPLITLSWWWWHRSPRQAHERIGILEERVDDHEARLAAYDAAWTAWRQATGGTEAVDACVSGQAEPGDCPGGARVTQRDLDDAVAELIAEARQEFGRGGAR